MPLSLTKKRSKIILKENEVYYTMKRRKMLIYIEYLINSSYIATNVSLCVIALGISNVSLLHLIVKGTQTPAILSSKLVRQPII